MTSTNSTTTVPMFTKEIRFDRETKDFAMYLNGELVGYAPNYLQADIELNNLVHDILSRSTVADTADVPAEDALDVLNALAMVEAETETETAPTDGAPTETTTTPRYVSSDLIYHDFRHVNVTIDDDGTLTIDPSGLYSKLIKLLPVEAYDLYTFFTKFPHVAAMMERLEVERQQDFARTFHAEEVQQAETLGYKRGYEAAAAEFAASLKRQHIERSVA